MADVLVLQHEHCEPLGTIEDALTNEALSFRYVQSYAGQPVPRELGEAPGLIVMGGPMGVYETERYPFLKAEMRLIEQAVACGVPTLGVCLGSQLIATVLGSVVRHGSEAEIGWHLLTRTAAGAADPLWQTLPSRFMGFHWHGDIFDAPPGAVSLAFSALTPCQAFRYGESAYGSLSHMEVTEAILNDWTMEFDGELAQAGLTAGPILDGIPAHLPLLQEIGGTVFGAWAAQAARYGSESR